MSSVKTVLIRRLQPINPSITEIDTELDTYFKYGTSVNTDGPVYTCSKYDFRLNNKFVETYVSAYINHGNAVFSPSDLLFIFNMSFAKFSKENSDLIKKYVNPEFDGTKKKLEVLFPDHGQPSKLDIINNMVDDIKLDMYNSELLNILENDLSSATEMEKTSCNVAIMDSVEQFYKFKFQSYCGFNNIKLIGTPEDWRNLRSKVQKIGDLFSEVSSWKSYCGKFIKILDKFVSCFGSSKSYDVINFLNV